MRVLRDLSIKQKLLLITMVPIAVSLVLAGIAVVISDSILFRSQMQRDLSTLARIVSDNSTAALAFDDARIAAETLAALKARPHIVAACIYKKDGTIFAQYSQPEKDDKCATPAEQEEIRSSSGELIASRPILLDNERIGTLVMRYDLAEVTERTTLYIEIVLTILLASSLIAFLLSSRLREIIATPISRLALAAASVSHTADYSVRVEKYSRDELGVLVDTFNEMLARVESRDSEVQNARYSLQTTLSSIGDAVISTDLEGQIVFTNPAARSLLRLPEHDLVGKHIDQMLRIIDEFTRKQVEIPVRKVLRDGATVGPEGHTLLIAGDGTEFPIDHSAAPIRDARGEMTGVVLIFRDISNRRATEKLLETQAAELRQRANQLKEADQRKDHFLAMLAHELRNPLAPIRNAIEVLKRVGGADPNQRWVSEVMERQTQHLTRLVDDLLDVSRITRGKVTLQQETLELSMVINRAVEASRPMIEARKHQITISLPNQSVRLKGDLTRLVQVVGNILNNAAKFTDEGGVIRLEALQKDGEVIIRVMDNGIGLPSDLVPHVFDLFSQADRSLDRSQGGLGIGLTIVRNLVELHGGSVDARSEGLGRGSEFIVRLPALASATVGSAAVSPDEQRRPDPVALRILVLEDNVDSAEVLAFMLKLEGHEVRIAYSGAVALEAAHSFQPQVILCDIGLPGMNGYEVALQLRARPEFKETRLIALSGYGQEDDRRHSKEAGFDYHLTKPVEPGVLTALIGALRSAAARG